MDLIQSWLVPLSAALAAGLSIWNFIQSPSKKNESEIVSLRQSIELLRRDVAAETNVIDDKVATLAGRIQLVEGEIRHLPDRDAAHRLEMAVERLNGRIETLDERLKPVASIADRMQELLIEQSKR